MYVCICQGVTQKDLEAAIDAGATDLEALGARCGAGTCCGSCHPVLEDLLVKSLLRRCGVAA